MYCKNCSPSLASCVKCMTGSPDMTSFVIICEVLSLHTFFSNPVG
jgi:hypothetical protein